MFELDEAVLPLLLKQKINKPLTDKHGDSGEYLNRLKTDIGVPCLCISLPLIKSCAPSPPFMFDQIT